MTKAAMRPLSLMAIAPLEGEVMVPHLILMRNGPSPRKKEAITVFLGVLQFASRVVAIAGLAETK
jgi:hypothetical protein